ncbi:MAG TPA: spore cortex-lytic enzyme [Firmicutes bacterium]|nr:spore cortex-lytic enzyme [Bacillota bacterium]
MRTKIIPYFQAAILAALNLFAIALIAFSQQNAVQETLSRYGSRGNEVRAIQQELRDRSLYKGSVDGIYGTETQEAVKKFQKQQGLTADGIAGPATLSRLGISVGTAPSATTANVQLLARIISAEGRGETYTGQVAIGAVILNRIEHPSFPDTLSGVIYQPGAFTAITDGQFNEPIADSAYNAARDALNGWDPSGGAIYYYNPSKTSNQWIRQRPVIKTIGNHVFCS